MPFDLPSDNVLRALQQQEAEVRQAEPRPADTPEIDPKNPVVTVQNRASLGVATVLKEGDKGALLKDASSKVQELKIEGEKRIFLQKLYPTLKENNPELKQAIERQTIQIFDVPGRDLYALSLDGKNVDYLYEKGGKEYFNLKKFRGSELIGNMIEELLEHRCQIYSKNTNWTFTYSQNGKSIGAFSPEFLSKLVVCVDIVNTFGDAVDKEATRRGINSESNNVEKYKQLHDKLDKEATLENIDDILKRPRRMFLESHITSLFNGKFDKDWNIVIWTAKTVQKWSSEYNSMVEKWLKDLRVVMHALIQEAEKRWTDPDSL